MGISSRKVVVSLLFPFAANFGTALCTPQRIQTAVRLVPFPLSLFNNVTSIIQLQNITFLFPASQLHASYAYQSVQAAASLLKESNLRLIN